MDLTALRNQFAVAGVAFDEMNGLLRMHVDTPEAAATLYLQGAHLTAWQPAGFEPAILLSHKSDFAPGKPIRGGIPIVFPWFATDTKQDRIDGHPGPTHGFARIQDWTLESVKRAAGVTALIFTLGPTAMSRSMGFDHFLLTLEFHIGTRLAVSMTVANLADQPLRFEEAFHTYYEVADVHEATVSGLEATPFIDKTDNFKLKPAAHQPIRFTKTEDRIYNNTVAPCILDDIAGRRRFLVSKSGSRSTVVWNAGMEMPDLGPWDWHEYVAVETANVGENAVTLAPGASSKMQLQVQLERVPAS